MSRQPPLLDQVGASLPGPEFTPRPGWGGQLRRWLPENISTLFFRLVIVGALMLLGRALWIQLPARDTTLDTPTTTPTPSNAITLLVQPGEGVSHVAAHALNLYILSGEGATPMLDAAQHLFAVNTLTGTIGQRPLVAGEVLSLDTAIIESAVQAAQRLTPAQKSAWAKLLRR